MQSRGPVSPRTPRVHRWFRAARGAGVAVVVLLLGLATPVRAQEKPPRIGPFVADVRGAFAHLGQNAGLASLRGLNATDLPSIGLGISIDGHWYPLKWHGITFGLGVEVLLARGHHGAVGTGPAVTTTFNAFSPQLSFNFGSGRGWSYLSGGVGPALLLIQPSTVSAQPTEHVRVINYGAGARWFTTHHLAFTFDIRFYDLQQKAASGSEPGNPHVSMFVGSVGIGIK